ncbi:MAG: uncharacterized protein KVP18_003976 [Porospora cf. gigantea A]|uniref:uncharacterized protein n=3 Tax=Porospora cf. gigantea A TaxID=2853593 RepID=UPI0035593CA9|nr:MAG: hypothetical protein KVP18_003976 [Porospora cf. gigantea A]
MMKPLANSVNGMTRDELRGMTNAIMYRAGERIPAQGMSERTVIIDGKASPCTPDYSTKCPRWWSYIQASDTCQAYEGYQGRCRASFTAGMMDEAMRANQALDCGYDWTCKEESAVCDPDPNAACPVDFIGRPEGCVPGPEYKGFCRYTWKLKSMSMGEILALCKSCQTRWPCLAVAATSSTQWSSTEGSSFCPPWTETSRCPLNWHEDNGFCHSEVEVCGHKTWRFTYYTPVMRREMSGHCNMEFTCESSVGDVCRANTTLLDCPLTQFGLQELKSDPSALLSLLLNCGAHFLCKPRDCPRAWHAPCPAEWFYDGEGCHPPHLRKGPPECLTYRNWRDVSEKSRRQWASECEYPWPCVGTKIHIFHEMRGPSINGAVLPDTGKVEEAYSGVSAKQPHYFMKHVDSRESPVGQPVNDIADIIGSIASPRLQRKLRRTGTLNDTLQNALSPMDAARLGLRDWAFSLSKRDDHWGPIQFKSGTVLSGPWRRNETTPHTWKRPTDGTANTLLETEFGEFGGGVAETDPFKGGFKTKPGYHNFGHYPVWSY